MLRLDSKKHKFHLLGFRKGARKMTKHIFNPDYYECYEYHGNTTIERTRKQAGITIWRDWITFDTVEEATQYFNENCNDYEYSRL
jgi:hypothetical protein